MDFIRSVVDGEDEVNTLRIVQQVRRHFKGDKQFLLALADETLGVLTTRALEDIVRKRRAFRLTDSEGRIKALLAEIIEPADERSRKTIITMKRSELLWAANEREHQATGLLKWATFERDLAGRMSDDEKTVGESFSTPELNAIWCEHFERQELEAAVA